MTPVERLKCFLDPDVIAVAGALVGAPLTTDEAAAATGIDPRGVVHALASLRTAELVVTAEGGYQVDVAALRGIAAELADPVMEMDPVIGFGMTDDERIVLERFFEGRTLREVPSSRAKRLIVLERLALEFDVGRRYLEREVNSVLGAFHPDWSTLRRHLVDEGLLDRDQNVYWRSGGRIAGVYRG